MPVKSQPMALIQPVISPEEAVSALSPWTLCLCETLSTVVAHINCLQLAPGLTKVCLLSSAKEKRVITLYHNVCGQDGRIQENWYCSCLFLEPHRGKLSSCQRLYFCDSKLCYCLFCAFRGWISQVCHWHILCWKQTDQGQVGKNIIFAYHCFFLTQNVLVLWELEIRNEIRKNLNKKEYFHITLTCSFRKDSMLTYKS